MKRKNASYKFTEFPDGFRISARKRKTVEVRLVEYGLSINVPVVRSRATYIAIRNISINKRVFGLYEMNRLIRSCAAGLMMDWKPPLNKQNLHIRRCKRVVYLTKNPHPFYENKHIKIPWLEIALLPKWFGIYGWAETQCRKAIATQVKGQVERLRQQVPAEILKVQKNAFSATLECPDELRTKAFYDQLDEYTIRDLGKYRAAAILAANLKKDDLYDGLKNWRKALSYNGESYHALNVTLDNFPGGIPNGLFRYLCDVKLPRPITDRVEFIALCTYLEKERRQRELPHRGIFLHARRDDILKAADHFRGSKIDRRGSRELMAVIEDMVDYPDQHNGRILGLAKKSRMWHRQTNREEILTRHKLNLEDPVQIPPIELPQDVGVRFLATVGDIINEGEDMGHCVGSYAPRAAKGHCYLFHVSENGDEATAEVSVFDNSVSQVRGSYNKNNGACRHAEKVLSKWAKDLPKVEFEKEERFDAIPVPF